MLGLLFLLQAGVAVGDEIIVTGQKLVAAQAQCVAGGCTPLRDAQASIALAEMRFRDGEYQDAKRVLAGAVARNRAHEAAAPRAVAAIYEAYATVSLHEGDKQVYRRAVADQVRVLNAHLPADDPSVLSAATALGEMWIELGNFQQAEATYRGIEEKALAAGRERAAMLAGMKRVWIEAARERSGKPYRMIDALEARPVAKEDGFATALKVLRLRVAARDATDRKADGGAIDSLIAQLGQAAGPEPVLLVSPPYDLDAQTAANRASRSFDMRDAVQADAATLAAVRWADVGFWVRPDGRTAEVEILRGSPGRGWMAPALRQIAGRRYSAAGDAGVTEQGGVYRVERFTASADRATPTGSHIKRRVATGGYEVLDLTAAPAAPPS